MTSRELVHATLEFRNKSGHVPRDMWTLPWAKTHYQGMIDKIKEDFPKDMTAAPILLAQPTIEQGDPYLPGIYTDAWGCKFEGIHAGVMGEVKTPLVQDDDWEDYENVHIPYEWLTFDVDAVNAYCRNTEKFVNAGQCPKAFEQLQFIRSTENLFMDLIDPPANMIKFMQKMHTFHCDLLEKWAKTEVDALVWFDDWGSQRSLLIRPAMWEELFAPMYKDFIDIAKRHGKKCFMHSDGYIMDIYPKLIEYGLDAINSQIFCMGIDEAAKYKGKITFWGEIDRQHILVDQSTKKVEEAVEEVYEKLWDNGGCIAQCEFGPGAKPENVYKVYETWAKLRPGSC